MAANHHIIANLRAAGDADLSGDQAVPSDAHVMGNLHEVVYLAALADNGVAQRATIDGRVCADLDVILNDGSPELRKFLLASFGKDITESIRADHRPCVNDYAIADANVRVNNYA